MMNEVLKDFIHDDVDQTLLPTFDTERKQITFTQEQKNIYCAETKLLFKKNESSQEKKEIHKIPIDYLPRDKINQQHITCVFPEVKYKHDEINKHMQNMTNLKENFKQVARNKIECGYLDFAHKLGWRRPDGQPLINKKQFFSYIKTSEKDELDFQRDLYYLTYDRFKKGENDEIVNFVEQFMIDNNMEYYNQEKKMIGKRRAVLSLLHDINKKIRKNTSNMHKSYITKIKFSGENKKYNILRMIKQLVLFSKNTII